ncbi:hypothetical protein LTR10_022526 [Elasticomyces elasticus]|nr:hypothetical protein LTR10_022526 [Elasticomyces elasticus]
MVNLQSFSRVKREMEYWEHVASQMDGERGSQTPASAREASPSKSAPDHSHADAMILYTLAGSLLLDWIVELTEKDVPSQSEVDSSQREPWLPPRASAQMPPPPRRGWQLVRALSILRRPETYETWTRSHLGWWPVSIFGLAADHEEDISLIKDVLLCTRQRLGYGLVDRVLADLEQVWEARDRSQHIPKVEEIWVEDLGNRPASPVLVN